MAAYKPISGDLIQRFASNVAASGYYLKGYVAGTTTALAMGIDSTPTSTLAKAQYNSEGYAINGSDAPFIPHFNKNYKLVLFSNATDADNDTFANAVTTVDNITLFDSTESQWLGLGHTPTRLTNTTFQLATGDGDQTTEYHAGRRLRLTDSSTLYATITDVDYNSTVANATHVTVGLDSGTLSASLTAVELGIIAAENSSLPLGFYPLKTGETGVVDYRYEYGHVKRYGAKGDWNGSTGTDDTTAFQNCGTSVQALGGGKVILGDATDRYLIHSVTATINAATIYDYPVTMDFTSLDGIEIVSSSAEIHVSRDYASAERDVIFRFSACKNPKVGTIRWSYSGSRPDGILSQGVHALFFRNNNINIELDDQYATDLSIVVGDYPESRLTQTNTWSDKHFTIYYTDTGYPYITDNGGTGLRCSIIGSGAGRECTLQDVVDAKVRIRGTGFTASSSIGLSGTLKDIELEATYIDTANVKASADRYVSINLPVEFNTDYTTYSGTHSGANGASVLTGSGFPTSGTGLVGYTVKNTTDGSYGVITANTSTTVTATLIGGTDNDWDTSDAYSIGLSHECDNVKLKSHVETYNGAYIGYPMLVGIGVGASGSDIDPAYKLRNVELDCKVRTDTTNQLGFTTQWPSSWSALGQNIYNLKVKLNQSGAALPSIQLQGLADHAIFENPLCDLQLQIATDNQLDSGTDDTSSGALFLTDSTATWTTNEYVGDILINTTDGSWGVITANTGTTVTARMQDGTTNLWDSGDAYRIKEVASGKITMLGGEIKRTSGSTHDASDITCINTNLTESASDQSLVNKKFISTIFDGVERNKLNNTGFFTMDNDASTTVTDDRVNRYSSIMLIPHNAAAATLQAGTDRAYVASISAGTSFNVDTAAAGNAAGTEIFKYVIFD